MILIIVIVIRGKGPLGWIAVTSMAAAGVSVLLAITNGRRTKKKIPVASLAAESVTICGQQDARL